MDLYGPTTETRVADRPPARPRGAVLSVEHGQGNLDLAAALEAEPDELARALAAAVYRLRPAALQKVARLVIEETSNGSAA